MRQILVAVDDSEASERVADFVNRFSDGFDASTTAVNVGTATLGWGPYPAATGALYPWPYWSYGMAVPPAGAPPSDGPAPHRAREAAEQTVASSDVRASHHVVELGGDVADTLRRVASERHVDLLVVRSSHKGSLDRLLSPSVSTDLAKSAPVSVLVVH